MAETKKTTSTASKKTTTPAKAEVKKVEEIKVSEPVKVEEVKPEIVEAPKVTKVSESPYKIEQLPGGKYRLMYHIREIIRGTKEKCEHYLRSRQ